MSEQRDDTEPNLSLLVSENPMVYVVATRILLVNTRCMIKVVGNDGTVSQTIRQSSLMTSIIGSSMMSCLRLLTTTHTRYQSRAHSQISLLLGSSLQAMSIPRIGTISRDTAGLPFVEGN